jgi:hypothetical protein
MSKIVSLSHHTESNKKPSKVIKFSPKQKAELIETLSEKEGNEFNDIAFGLGYFANTNAATAKEARSVLKGKKLPFEGLKLEYRNQLVQGLGDAKNIDLRVSDYRQAS